MQLFANNAATVTVGTTLVGATTINVANGAVFPSPTASDFFKATLVGLDVNGNESAWEIVKVTGRSGNALTVVRAQEGTTAIEWAAGTRIDQRLTAGDMNSVSGSLLNSVSGTNTITASAPATMTGYVTGHEFSFVAAGSITGAATLNINSLGDKSIKKQGSNDLELGDIVTGQMVKVTYDGTNFQLGSGAGGSGAKAGGVIYENGQTISANYTITSGKNAHSAGPITIADGVAVTVPDGSRWVIS